MIALVLAGCSMHAQLPPTHPAQPTAPTGRLAGGQLPLTKGDELVIAAGDFVGGPGRISTTYAELPRSVHAGDVLLLDDGRIQLEVKATTGTELTAIVIEGGLLGDHKGINAPGVPLPPAGLTAKDASDLQFGIRMGVDFVALSFGLNF